MKTGATTLAAALLLSASSANAYTASVPAPGTHDGLGLPYTIWSSGPFPSDWGQVLVGMSNDGGRTHAHFRTDDNPYSIYWILCNTSAGNDTYGARAHTVAVTWWPQSWGNLPAGSPFPGPWDLPRPGTSGDDPDITGGQTVTNSIGDGYTPMAGLLAHGLVYGNGWTWDGVTPNTSYNIDLVVRAVFDGNMSVLGTTCQVTKAY